MRPKVVIAVAAIIVILIIGIFFLMRSSSGSRDNSGSKPFFELFSRNGSSDQSILMQDTSPAFGEFINQLKNGKVNFVWELWAMRAQCPESQAPEACDAGILKFIDERYSSPEKEKLKDLFQKYFKYESTMREFGIPSDLSFTEKYDILKKKRRELLGKDDAELVFGMEESQVEFMDLSTKLAASNKNQSGDERVKQYNALKKTTYGSYYDSIVSREDKFQNYETEIGMREDDFKKMSDSDKKSKMAAIQEQYFGKEAAQKIAQAEQEEAADRQKISDYESKEKEFLSQNASMSAADKTAKLREMRVQILGKDDADAYDRRRQFEEDVKNIK